MDPTDDEVRRGELIAPAYFYLVRNILRIFWNSWVSHQELTYGSCNLLDCQKFRLDQAPYRLRTL
jgi:hypothetical protein